MAILRRRLPGHRLNSQAVFLSLLTDIDGRRWTRRPVPIRRAWEPPCRLARAAARPRRYAHLGGQRHNGRVGMGAGEQPAKPGTQTRVARPECRHGGARALDLHLAKVTSCRV